MYHTLAIAAAVLAFTCGRVCLSADTPALIASYLTDDSASGNSLIDSGPLHLHGDIKGATLVEDVVRKHVLVCDGEEQRVEIKAEALKDKAFAALTVAAWVRIDRFPQKGFNGNVWQPNPEGWFITRLGTLAQYAPPCFQFRVGVHQDGRLRVQGGWSHTHWKDVWADSGKKIARGEWTHVALTYRRAGELKGYINGELVAMRSIPFTLWWSNNPIVLGGADCSVAFDDLYFYGSELGEDEIRALMKGSRVPSRAFTNDDAAKEVYAVQMSLTRFDMPGGRHSFRQNVRRMKGPDAVDWPRMWLSDGRELFTEGPNCDLELTRKFTKLYFRDTGKDTADVTIEPYGHWLRAQPWIWNQHNIYSTDPTARMQHGHEYELWTFPLKIEAEGEIIETVQLRLGGRMVYERTRAREKVRSLLLQLPSNVSGGKYELVVNGLKPVRFDVGLQPYTPGAPRDVPIETDLAIAGGNAPIRVFTPLRPEQFPNQKEWDQDLAAMKTHAPAPEGFAPAERRTLSARVGIDAPRSSVTYQAVYMRHGMSHGFASGSHTSFEGTAEAYFTNIERMGFDRIFEAVDRGRLEAKGMEWWSTFLKKSLAAGVQVGFNASELGDSSWPVFSYNLSEWHASGIRDAQLLFQRFLEYPHIAGTVAGGESAGYKGFWMWAPPTPDRPWSRAMAQFHKHSPKRLVVTQEQRNQHYWAGWNEGRGSAREFYDYCEYYDRMYGQYALLRDALAEIDPSFLLTLGAYGEGPGASSTGGWGSAGCIPGRPLFKDVPILQAYDWNETPASKPLHNVALMDRLRGYYPEKPLWTIVDDFGVFFAKLPRERAYALALTRGPAAIGTNALPHVTGPWAKDEGKRAAIADYGEIGRWVRKYGGAYSTMRPESKIAIYYSNEQGRCRVITGEEAKSRKPEDIAKIRKSGSHEGKTTEALVICTAAGWPAQIVTSETLRDGLPEGVKTLLLTGLNRFDESWSWYDGLEDDLARFIDGGGRILLDDESVCPVKATKTRLSVAPYVPQGAPDLIDLLLERNEENIRELDSHMAGVERPVVNSGDPTIWCIPSTSGDVQYVTVVNYGWEKGKNASQSYKPATASLSWRTKRSIYDVFASEKLTAAARCDLTKRAFVLYALPPHDPSSPAVTVRAGTDGFYYASVSMSAGGEMRGVPVQLDITHGTDAARVFTATGLTAKLPVAHGDDAGMYRVKATELLGGKTSNMTFELARAPEDASEESEIDPLTRRGLLAFAKRRDVPLQIALTPEQAADVTTSGLAQKLKHHYESRGRSVVNVSIEPNGLVLGMQIWKSISKYPYWRTADVDLLLLGTPGENVLMFDQARGGLLRGDHQNRSTVQITYSPFVAERHCVNIIARDSEGLSSAVDALLSLRELEASSAAALGETTGPHPAADDVESDEALQAARRPSPERPQVESSMPLGIIAGIAVIAVIAVVVFVRSSSSKKPPRSRRTPTPGNGRKRRR